MSSNQSWIIGLLLTTLLPAALAGHEQPAPARISIVIYDAAHVGPKTLDRAERLAASILLTAAIQPRWETGEIRGSQKLRMDFTAYTVQQCQAFQTAQLSVQILRHAPVGVAANALGFSLPCARSGIQVTIYADRVGKVSSGAAPTFARVLGYALAHELGHVLLRSGAHEPAGLMKAVWSESDWQRAAVSVISFSPADAKKIAALHSPVKAWLTVAASQAPSRPAHPSQE